MECGLGEFANGKRLVEIEPVFLPVKDLAYM